MQIAHIAIWTEHIDELRRFYADYFGGSGDSKYVNAARGFESYMLSFEGACRLELMCKSDIRGIVHAPRTGLAHFAFSCKNREEVLNLTERLRADGFQVVGEPRTTGHGTFESVVADPDGNLVEITC